MWVMPGYVNYFYTNGEIPAHTQSSFKEYDILTVHGVIVRNALTLMHKIKYFPNTVPNSIRSLFADNTLTYNSNHENSAVWLETYSSPVFRADHQSFIKDQY